MTDEIRKMMQDDLRKREYTRSKGFHPEGDALFYGCHDLGLCMYVGKIKDFDLILSRMDDIKKEYKEYLEDSFQKPYEKISCPEFDKYVN